jgi:hypothetical protein
MTDLFKDDSDPIQIPKSSNKIFPNEILKTKLPISHHDSIGPDFNPQRMFEDKSLSKII